MRVHWFDDGIVCIDCECGLREMMVHLDEDKVCERCGRVYRMSQNVELVRYEAVPSADVGEVE